MSDELYSLAYFSRNTMTGPPEAIEAGVGQILHVSRDNNRLAGVTGALLFSGGCFAQVLEGPQSVLEDLFETIQYDPRHDNVTILHFHAVAARSFGGWSMAYAGQADDLREQAVAAKALGSPDQITTAADGHGFLAVLTDYIRRSEQGSPVSAEHD